MSDNKIFYIVQSWCYKNQSSHDNDQVEIMGIFQDLGNAYDFMNHRYRFYLMEKHRQLIKNLFPKKTLKEKKEKAIRKVFGRLVTDKIVGYLYAHLDSAIEFCQPIKRKVYNGESVILNLELDRLYLQLMAFQKWISNQTESAYFPEYTDIQLFINNDIEGLARKISASSCRIYLFDNKKKQLIESFYLGDNLLDLESCEHRERHFCSSYRIHTKTLRD